MTTEARILLNKSSALISYGSVVTSNSTWARSAGLTPAAANKLAMSVSSLPNGVVSTPVCLVTLPRPPLVPMLSCSHTAAVSFDFLEGSHAKTQCRVVGRGVNWQQPPVPRSQGSLHY